MKKNASPLQQAAGLLALLVLFQGALVYGSERVPPSVGFADAARMAVAASEDLKHEYAGLAIREGAWTWGIRAYFPKLSISASEDDRLSTAGPDSFLKSYSVSLDQLLWDGGRVSASRKIEKAELSLAGSQLEQTAAEIAEGAIASYRRVLSARTILEIREKAWESLEEQRRILNRELELGLVLPMDLVEADITLAEAEIEILSLRLDLSEAEQKLAEFLGLEKLPLLSEKVDIQRSPRLPSPERARSLAEAGNPDLAAAIHSVERRRVEARYAGLSWLPSVRLIGSAGLNGRQYPLTRYNWSVGVSVDFSSPWLSGSMSGSAGWEPPYDRTAGLKSTMVPAPDPASAFSAKTASLSLALEKEKYNTAFRETGRQAERGVEKCGFLERKRAMAVKSLELEGERYRLAERKLELGKLTRVELMEARLDYAKREAAAVEAAVSLLEGERELERLLGLKPGELAAGNLAGSPEAE
jgi:outer membrane protein TolC